MKIICFGDSNTYGFDPRGPIPGRYEAPWPEIIREKTGWNVVNEGKNGRSVVQRPREFPPDTDLLVVMLGTNDLLNSRTPETATAKMERFLRRITLEHWKILLIAPPTMCYGEWVPAQSLIDQCFVLSEHYRRLGEHLGIRFVSAGDWDIPMAYDGVHMTQDGHIKFAENLLQYIQENLVHS